MKLTAEKLELFQMRDDAAFTWAGREDFQALVADAAIAPRLAAALEGLLAALDEMSGCDNYECGPCLEKHLTPLNTATIEARDVLGAAK